MKALGPQMLMLESAGYLLPHLETGFESAGLLMEMVSGPQLKVIFHAHNETIYITNN